MGNGDPVGRLGTGVSRDTSSSGAGTLGDIEALAQSSDTSDTGVLHCQDWERALRMSVTSVTP